MMLMTVSEFRRDMRKALEAVDSGQEVVLTRHEKVYLFKRPLNPDSYQFVVEKKILKDGGVVEKQETKKVNGISILDKLKVQGLIKTGAEVERVKTEDCEG